MQDKVKGYSRVQVGLHWAVVVLVAFQFLAHNAIEAAWNAGNAQTAEGSANPILVTMHIVGGVLVLLMALTRIYLRVTRGAPEPPADEPRIMKLISEAVHGLIYVMLLALPASGIMAWFFGIRLAAVAHEYLQAGLLGLIAAHIGGALFQHLIRRSDVMMRMFAPDKA
ncbi:cytochrome b/b6 domain-containing protein [Rhizobium sp. RU36D]|uniref:cytochrome b n=1 Tax=Rhizobium sp. RU36D TaxID=1907415 RepID=UPI0009D84358|nr:cytochrome b/b6 domain-containing protein [Rhizobium sp. RU36D]SMC51784.1 cytochrome b561 [Rhizobium sp. RU36D]